MCYFKQQNFSDSMIYYDQVINLNQENIKAHFNKGRCLKELKYYK